MRPDVAGVATLSNGAIGVGRAIGVNRVRAVVLLVCLAVVAREVGANLCTDTGAIADLQTLDLGADLDDLSNNLMSYAEREGNILSPPSRDGVDVRGADTASINSNINVVLFEFLERELERLSEATRN